MRAGNANGFDRLARIYVGMEKCFAGPFMQRCRTAHLDEVRPARQVLMVGEGPGRFLKAVLATSRTAQCRCVDGSAAMLDEARRVVTLMNATDRVSLEQHDVLQWAPPAGCADVLATHFFLDCFDESQLELLVPRLAQSLKRGGAWIVSDFRIPQGVLHLPAALLLRMLYAFFRRTTGIAARRLADPAPCLRRSGLVLERQESMLGGLLNSDLWRMPS